MSPSAGLRRPCPPAPPECGGTGRRFLDRHARPHPRQRRRRVLDLGLRRRVPTSGTSAWSRTSLTRSTPSSPVTLTSPSGTVVTLTSKNGGPNANVFNGTAWDQQANPLGQIPYASNAGLVTDQIYVNGVTASPLAPEEPLGAFTGEDPNGTWTLRVSDDAAATPAS